MRRTWLAVAALALVGLPAIAGCGGGGGSSSSTGSSSSGGESSSGGAAESAAATEGASEAAAEPEGGGEAASEGGAAAGVTSAAVVKVMSTPKLGKVIVDSNGMTLYDFHKDKGRTSACYGACAEAWPPLLTKGEPEAAGGAEASLLGTTERKDGTIQVTYNGHPLYGFVEDQKPGETNGNDLKGFGAAWYALQPDGEEPPDS